VYSKDIALPQRDPSRGDKYKKYPSNTTCIW